MKKMLALLLSASLALVLCACADRGSSADPAAAGEEEKTGVGLANPFVEYETLQSAEEAAGFGLAVPESVEGYSEKVIQLANGKMLQVLFLDGDSRLIIRKEKGIRDISGDYNRYPEIETEIIGGGDYPSREVILKGADGNISCAVWQDGEYTFAVVCDRPMPADAMRSLIASVA